MRRAALLLVLATALALAGCGGGDSDSSGDGDTAGATTAVETSSGSTGSADGEEVFVSAGCGGCHTLAAAQASGSIGPNLDEQDLTTEQVVAQVTNGGGAMPGFQDDLTPEEIQAVAEYVVSVAGT